MTRWLLDTNVLADVARNPTGQAARRLITVERDCILSIIVVAEVRFGFHKNSASRSAQRALELIEQYPIFPFEAPADTLYAELRVDLEKAGTPIGANDMLIAAHALALDATLVTANDGEFRRVPGLRVENWVAA